MSMRYQQLLMLGLFGLIAPATHAADSRFDQLIFENSLSSLQSSTHLIEIRQGSYLSQKASSIQGQGFELSSGTWVSFESWYHPNWTDARVSWMTQISQTTGVIWGISTGEYADKYTINPSIKLGLIRQTETAKSSFLTFRGTAIVGGHLKEKTCTADYGAIGGVQQVNCRLAASTLEPSQTLQFLLNERPYDQYDLSLQFRHVF